MTSSQQGHWASKLISIYATAFYLITISLGWANISLENGKLRRITKRLRCYATAVSMLQMLYMAYYLLLITHNALHLKIEMSIELLLPSFLYVIIADVCIIHLHLMNALRRSKLHAFIKKLCNLRAKTEQLMSTFEEFEGYAIFTSFHWKAFGIYAVIEIFHFAYSIGTHVMTTIEVPTWILFYNGTFANVLFDLHQRSLAHMFVVALMVFDAIAHRLEELLLLTLGSKDTRHLKVHGKVRHVLLDLYVWSEEANRLFAVSMLMNYSLVFLGALSSFYCVYARVYGSFFDNPVNYVVMGVQLIKHCLVNQYAEHTRHSFRQAIDAVERVHLSRRSCIKPDEHLLLLYSKKMSFRCGTFSIQRSLTIRFYAEVFNYILTLVQFKMEKDLLSKL